MPRRSAGGRWLALVRSLGVALTCACSVLLAATGAAAQPRDTVPPAAPTEPPAVPMPSALERPVEVRLAVRWLDLTRVHEVSDEVGGVVEVTQRWTDPTQRFDRVTEGRERVDLTGAEAEARLTTLWTPAVVLENLIGRPRAQTLALSVFHDGRIVLIRRLDADFRIDLGMGAFPFDRQRLALRFSSSRHAADEVVLVTTEDDRQFSTIGPTVSAAQWRTGRVVFRHDTFFGWNARPYARLVAVADVQRDWSRYILRLFVPFLALMSLSLFLLWAPEEVIALKDRAPMIFSSLLALAALSFTFESSFPGAISLNSPVATMISVGYVYLPTVLLVDLLLRRTDSRLARRYPALLPEIRRHVRVTLPLLFFAFCALLVAVAGDDGARPH